MLNQLRITFGVILFGLLLVAATPASHAQTSYEAIVTLLPCAGQAGGVEAFVAPTAPYENARSHAVSVNIEKGAGDISVMTARLPRDHMYLWIFSGECAAEVPSMAIGETQRYYVARLRKNFRGNFEQRSAFIAGALPFRGISRVELIAADWSHSDQTGFLCDVSSQYYYCESPPLGTMRLRITVSSAGPTYNSDPIATYDRTRLNFALLHNVSIAELLSDTK
jgi:hypothetical protein